MKRKTVRLLFICSRNQWRSPTAEAIWKHKPGFQARSAGTSPRAKRVVSADDIRWADWVFVMENKHRSRLITRFTRLLANKPVHVLGIPDEYQFMDPDLVLEISEAVAAVLNPKE